MKTEDKVNEILNDKELEEINAGISAHDVTEILGIQGVSNCCNNLPSTPTNSTPTKEENS